MPSRYRMKPWLSDPGLPTWPDFRAVQISASRYQSEDPTERHTGDFAIVHPKMTANLKRILTTSLAVLLSLIVFVGTRNDVVILRNWLIIYVIFLFSFLVLVVARLLLSERVIGVSRVRFPGPTHLPGWQPDLVTREPASVEFVKLARSTFLRTSSSRVLAQLLRMVVDPAASVSRITETALYTDEKWVHEITRTLSFSADSPIIAPIMRTRKGQLIDELSVQVNGNPTSTLPFLESQGAVAALIEVLFCQSFPDAYLEESEYAKALDTILMACCSASPVGLEQRTHLDETLRSLQWRRNHPQLFALQEALTQLIGFMLDYYFVFVHACPENSLPTKIRTSHSTPRSDTLGGLNRIRMSLGLSVRDAIIELPLATEARSYHFHTTAPDGAYFYNLELHPLALAETDAPIEIKSFAQSRQAIPKLSHTLSGRDFVHVYGRHLNGRLEDVTEEGEGRFGRDDHSYRPAVNRSLNVWLYAQYHERPPGILAVLLPLSAYLAILVWGVGYFHGTVFLGERFHYIGQSHLIIPYFDPTIIRSNSSSLTILFGIPALVSGWIASRIDGKLLQRISLSSFFLLCWSVFNAGAAVVLAVSSNTARDPSVWSLPGGVTLIHGTWAILMISTGSAAAFCVLQMISRTSRYWYRLDSAELGQSHLETNTGVEVTSTPGGSNSVTQVTPIRSEELRDVEGQKVSLNEFLNLSARSQNVATFDGGTPFSFPRLGLSDEQMDDFIFLLQPTIDEIYRAQEATESENLET